MPQWLKSTLIFFFLIFRTVQQKIVILGMIIISTINNVFSCSSILNSNGEKPLTAYLIHSIPLQQSAVQIFAGDKMSVVAHLVGMEQLGYEKSLGMTLGVSTT